MKHLLLAAIFTIGMLIFSSCASASKINFLENTFIPEDFAGIVHAGRTRTQREYAYLDNLGVKWVLQTFDWSAIEPQRDEWDFLFFDTIVDGSKAAGIKIIGILAYHNWWIFDDGKDSRYIPPGRMPDFLRYVRKTVEHFRGRVDAWCIWNEPNFSYFWQGTDEEFIELHRQSADVVRETDPQVIILGGAFNRGVLGLPEKFIRAFFESGAMDKTDAIAFHPYELNPYRTARLYERFRNIVDDYGFGGKIWLTEVGYPTGGLYPTRIQEKRLPEYVIKTWTLLAALGAQKLLWYQMFDPLWRKWNNSEDFFGLVRDSLHYSSKGAEAFRLCAQFISGTDCYAIEPGAGLQKSTRCFWFKGTGRGVLVLWNDSLGSKRVSLRFSGTDHTLHDPVSGTEKPIQPDTVIEVGRMPVVITWNGSEDKPYIDERSETATVLARAWSSE